MDFIVYVSSTNINFTGGHSFAQINPGWNDTPRVRPRKGTFEVRVVKAGADPEVVVSLTSMPRPFKKLRALDLSALAERVAASLEGDSKGADGDEAAGTGAAEAEASEVTAKGGSE